MNYSTPYTVTPSTIRLNNTINVSSDSVMPTTTYNVGYYDDTKVLSYISDLQNEVNDIERDFASKQWVENQGYLTEHQDLSNYATMNWVESQGYLTEHQDLSSYVSKDELSQELTSYVTDSELASYNYTSPLTSEQMNELFPLEINQ